MDQRESSCCTLPDGKPNNTYFRNFLIDQRGSSCCTSSDGKPNIDSDNKYELVPANDA